MKKLLLLLLVILTIYNTSALNVDKSTAERVAMNYYLSSHPDKSSETGNVTISFVFTDFSEQNNTVNFYAVNFSDTGFVLISGDDAISPVLAYSHTSFFTGEDIPVQLEGLLQEYRNLLKHVENSEPTLRSNVEEEWYLWLYSPLTKEHRTSTGPLISCLWDQGSFYNGLCPKDPAGPGGRVYAGCVATSMSIVMYYYRYPLVGQGQHGYMSDYGWLEVDYTQSFYDWEGMPTKLQGPNYPVAKLQYDAGVAVNMMYSPNGSGAYMDDAANAMHTYFGYNPDLELAFRDNYTFNDWCNLLRSQIDQGYPMIYAGYGTNGPGHAFVCDGYDSNNKFHFNWGWSGHYNGFYTMDYLTPGGYNFSNWQMAVINCYPDDTNYPYGCQGQKTLTSQNGSMGDGSGHLNYEGNSNCSWLISPEIPVEQITLTFHQLNTEYNADYVCVYDGADDTAPLLGCFSGDSVPNYLVSSGDQMYVTFQSNSTNHDKGFFADYNSKKIKFCQSFQLITDYQGTLEDGSGTYPYQSNTLCRWWINPDDIGAVIVDFTEFELEEDKDFLILMSAATYPSSEIIRFTGDQLPSTYIHYGSSLIVMFTSDDFNQQSGWKLNYSTLPASIASFEDILIEVYPNPFNDFITVSGLSGETVISLYDVSGKLILSETNSGEHYETIINTSSLSSGMYIFEIMHDEGTIRKKVIK